MIEYPPEFPEAAKAAVERAIADAEGDFEVGHWSPSDRVHRPSVYFTLKIFEAFMWRARATALDQRWTATLLREVTSMFLERVTATAFLEKHPQTWNPSLDVFRAAVHAELRKFSFWTRDFQDTLRELSVRDSQMVEDITEKPQPSDPVSTHVTGQFKKRAAWLVVQMRARKRLTPHRIEAIGGPNKRTVGRILEGLAVRDDVLQKLADALSDAGPAVKFEDIPRD